MSLSRKIASLSIGKGLNVVVNFLFLPFMARAFSISSYGTYSQAVLVVSFGVALLSFGLPQIIYVFLNKDYDQKKVVSSSLASSFGLGLLGCLLIVLTAESLSTWFENEELKSPLLIYSLSLIFTLPIQIINSILIFKDRVRQMVILSISSNLIKVLLVVAMVQLYHSVSLALLVIILSQLLQLIAGLFLIKEDITLKSNLKLGLEQIKKGFPVGLTGLLGIGILYMDGIMVSKIEGIKSFAIYKNGAFEVPYIGSVYASIAAITLPEVTKYFEKNNFSELISLKKKVIKNSMMLIYPIMIFLLFNSRDIISLYLGDKYIESAIIFAVFNLTLLIRVNDYHDILIAADKSRIILIAYLSVFILNGFLNYFLITYFGSIGAAVATVLSLLLFAFVLLKISLTYVNSSISKIVDYSAVLFVIAISLALAALLNYGLNVIEFKVLKLVISTTVYFPLVYYILVKRKMLSIHLVNRFFNKVKNRLPWI